jgi:hypothetical protein
MTMMQYIPICEPKKNRQNAHRPYIGNEKSASVMGSPDRVREATPAMQWAFSGADPSKWPNFASDYFVDKRFCLQS